MWTRPFLRNLDKSSAKNTWALNAGNAGDRPMRIVVLHHNSYAENLFAGNVDQTIQTDKKKFKGRDKEDAEEEW